ncbi:hypothetical protein Nepgr_025460 [Nepenthes gracilis]|uniref:RecA-like N-terminal domain-containing protein n=1 Tax=Nepenthes gracilis TaxID=150966 RepID=A0AAD3T6I6_NEPGR|nr:hypothetical protein Nepgr_025460 [Nepenthes gracilis]
MIAPTLGTLIPIIGASGFATTASVAGIVAGSVAIAASFGAAGAGLTDSKMVLEDLQTQLVSQALCKISENASNIGCTLIFMHQIRCKSDASYGNAKITSGGITLKFMASFCLKIQLIEKDNAVNGNEDSGLHRRAGPAEFAIIIGAGVTKPGCIFTGTEVIDVTARKWPWNSYKDSLCGEIEKVVRSLMLVGIGQVSSSYAGHLSLML